MAHPSHEGALVVVRVGAKFLLLRSSYRPEWNFPGGGIRRGESPESAAQRELTEEIGLSALWLVPVGVLSGLWDGRRDRVHFFETRLEQLSELRLDNREIVEAQLVSLSDLPNMMLTGPVIALVDYARTGGLSANTLCTTIDHASVMHDASAREKPNQFNSLDFLRKS